MKFEELRLGAEQAKELEKGIITETRMRGLDPLHAAYAQAQNMILLTGFPDVPSSLPHSPAYKPVD